MEAEDNRPDEIERLEESEDEWAFLREPDPPDHYWVQPGCLNFKIFRWVVVAALYGLLLSRHSVFYQDNRCAEHV